MAKRTRAQASAGEAAAPAAKTARKTRSSKAEAAPKTEQAPKRKPRKHKEEQPAEEPKAAEAVAEEKPEQKEDTQKAPEAAKSEPPQTPEKGEKTKAATTDKGEGEKSDSPAKRTSPRRGGKQPSKMQQELEIVDTEHGPNHEIVAAFKEMAEQALGPGEKHASWKGRAYTKVAETLSDLDYKVTNDPDVLKKVSGLPGVGKSSMKKINEYLEKGSVAEAAE